MTPTPPSTNSSTGGRSPEEQYRVVRKRNRVPLSCYPCRSRKLKCDRGQPCANCTRREGNATASCSYATPVNRKKSQSQSDASPDDMQNRIDRLEGLVLSLMHNGNGVDSATVAAAAGNAQSAPHSISDSTSSVARGGREGAPPRDDDDTDDDDELVSSLGTLKVDVAMGKSMYIGQEHWHNILSDIVDVKTYFNQHKKELEASFERLKSSKPVAAREGPTLLLGAVPATEEELRSALPPKSTVLTLCSRYFNSMDNAVNIIHGPTFQQQLRAHWQDPSKTPIMWLGLLYAALALAMLSYNKVGDEPPEWKGRSLEMAADFRLRTVQCLIRADYTKPVEYTVETMILYLFGESSARWDADLSLWMIVSLITRVAYRMGYHRDAKWFPSITPFQAEMRRRTWALVRMADVVFSQQVSLPSMIYEHDCDTQLPTNIFDDEFHPGMRELPPSRPSTEPTPISYMIAKSRLCNELGNILQATTDIGKHVPYDEIIRFDAKLKQIMRELPPHLQLTSLDGTHDPVTLLIARFNVDILCQKIFCLLHRKYLPRARLNPRYEHSRRSAIEASMRSLDHLSTLHRESQPSGRLRSVSWYVKSIAGKEFTLPAMLIILELHYANMRAQQQQDQEAVFQWSAEEKARMIEALERVGAIWKDLEDTSLEALKASRVVSVMLDKIKNPSAGDKEIGGDMPSAATPGGGGGGGGLAGIMSASMSPKMATPSAGMMMPDFTTPMGGSGGPNPPALQDNSVFMGMDFGGMSPSGNFDFNAEGFGAAPPGGPTSPFSMINTATGPGSGLGMNAVPDLTSNFDWGAFENYAQMSNWGVDAGLSLFGNPTDESPDKSMEGL